MPGPEATDLLDNPLSMFDRDECCGKDDGGDVPIPRTAVVG